MAFFGRVGTIVRAALDTFRHPGAAWSFVTGRSRMNWGATVGDGSGSSIVIACLNRLARTFPEAPIEVRKRTKDGWDAVPEHPMIELLRRPNPHMGGRLLWHTVMFSLHLTGDAYFIKLRSAGKRVVELWPVFPSLIEPVWEGNDFITAYEYRPGQGAPIYLSPEDVVHFRLGIDPDNSRKGLSPLKSLFREIGVDIEAGEFTAALLVNLGIPGVIISPDETGGLTQEDADAVKTKFMRRFSGDNRGEPLVMKGGTKVSVLSFNPQQMEMTMLRRLPEERVCAVLGVSATVAQLGAGLEHSTYSNMEEAKEDFYEGTIIPLQGLLCDELYAQLLPDFGSVTGLEVRFDLSQIRILQEDEDKRQERIRSNVLAGLMKVNEARTQLGLDDIGPAGDVFLMGSGLSVVNPADLTKPIATVVNPPDQGADRKPPQLQLVRALPAAETKAAGIAWHVANPQHVHLDECDLTGTIETKAAADGHTERLARVREKLIPAFEKDIAASLDAQAKRVVGRLGRKDAKAPDPDELLPKSEDERLAAGWRPHYTALIQGMWPILNEQLSLDVDFALDDPVTVAALKSAGERITGINDTTRAALAKALQEGAEAGEGVGQLTTRIRQVVEESYQGRAETISRTELSLAAQQATVGRYKAAGVTKVRVLDGDEDAACAGVHGTTQTIEWAEKNPIAHPRCVRSFTAVIEGVEEAA